MLEVCPVHSKGLPGSQDVRSPTDVDSKRLLKNMEGSSRLFGFSF